MTKPQYYLELYKFKQIPYANLDQIIFFWTLALSYLESDCFFYLHG